MSGKINGKQDLLERKHGFSFSKANSNTDHWAVRPTNDRVCVGAQSAEQTGLGAPSNDQDIRPQLFRLGTDGMRHIAPDNQLFSLCSNTPLEPVQLISGSASQLFAPVLLVVNFLSRHESRDGVNQEQTSIE